MTRPPDTNFGPEAPENADTRPRLDEIMPDHGPLYECQGDEHAQLKERIEAAVDSLISVLDALDAPGMDKEPTNDREGDLCDIEDGGDLEDDRCDDEDSHDREQPPEGGLG